SLREAGILYAPDYVINGGGIINVAAEISGEYDPAWVNAKLERLTLTLGEVLDQAQREGRATNRVADEIAKKRIAGQALEQRRAKRCRAGVGHRGRARISGRLLGESE